MSKREGTEMFQSSEIADVYLKYRYVYDSDVFDTIISFCKEQASAGVSLALDVGCGSGQSTVPLTPYFDKVIGLDVSEAQICNAPSNISNLSFRVGPAEDLSFVDRESVDLVTVAMALHWLDLDRFYREVERVLKPGGAFVVYGYGMLNLDDPTAQDIVNEFNESNLNKSETLKRVGKETKDLYRRYILPFTGWRRNDSLKMERICTIDEFTGVLSSFSLHHKRSIDQPTGSMSQTLKERLQSVYRDEKGGERKVHVTCPVFMLMGHKPQA